MTEHLRALAPILIIIVGVVFVGPQMYAQLRRGGPGPFMGYIPPFLRDSVNRQARRMEWPVPFDEDGELIPLAERRRQAVRPEPAWNKYLRNVSLVVIVAAALAIFILSAVRQQS